VNDTTHDLELLGDALQRAWRADHSTAASETWNRRRVALLIAVAVVLLLAGAAIASNLVKSAGDEEQGLLNGHLLFKGSHPSCRPLSDASFACTLDKEPSGMTFWEDGKQLHNAYLGVTAATTDTSRHVDGGCRSTSADGRAWRCYLGQDAVRHDIIAAELLGQYLPEPPTG
jgi:hypothetical protein